MKKQKRVLNVFALAMLFMVGVNLLVFSNTYSLFNLGVAIGLLLAIAYNRWVYRRL